MPLELTQHARDMLVERGISETWAERAVTNPEAVETDETDPGLEHCLQRVPEYGDRVLRVIADRTVSPVRIVTAYFDRGAKVKS